MTATAAAPNILLISDQPMPAENLPARLAAAGYGCQCLGTAEAKLFLGQQQDADLLILASNSYLGVEVEQLLSRSDAYLPVIIVATVIDDALLDAYSQINIDGYLTTPLNFRLLETKIRTALKMRQVYRAQIEQRDRLLEYRRKSELEQELAAKIYQTVLRSNALQTEAVKYVMSPLALFNGDLLLVEKTPDNHLYLLLGDFSGHGLSASVSATPVVDIFYGMARKGFALPDILQEINTKLYKILPTHMFLAATAVALCPDSKNLSLITCGLPDHFLVNAAEGSVVAVKAKNVPLGILESMALEVQDFGVQAHHRLYLMTDGILMAENPQGEAFGRGRVIDAIWENLDDPMAALQASLARHTRDSEQKDDISLVELICEVETPSWQTSPQIQARGPGEALHWKNAMSFDIDALRVINPVPVLVNLLMEIQGLQYYRQAIFLIISELFANALDHGVLKLDSAIKNSPEGFAQFYELRQERLSSWDKGWIRLLFGHVPTQRGGRLTIRVIDSGEGFDWKGQWQRLQSNTGFCGRGVKLVESLCSSLTYHGKGNRVTAVFDWVKGGSQD